MKFREKIILANIIIVLAVVIFSMLFLNIFIRQNFLEIIVGVAGRPLKVVIPDPGLRFLKNIRVILIISSAISILIAVIIAFFVSSKITKPLKEMGKFAKKIADGEYSARVETNSNDEIGDLARSLNYMAYRLDDIEKMRKTLIQNVSHDLRTPLSSIKGYLELLEDKESNLEEKKESLEVIKNQVNKMEKMVNELTNLSMIDGKQFQLNLTKMNIVRESKRICNSIKILADQKGIELKENYPENPVYILGDEKRIEEILTNLLNNAIKFTKEGFVSISISSDKSNAIIEIKDTGIGIDEKDLPHIFERFYRGDKARTSDESGIGIGLSIVKELVFAHGGQISVKSKINEGTNFILKFPLKS